jgi:hypothetical protein
VSRGGGGGGGREKKKKQYVSIDACGSSCRHRLSGMIPKAVVIKKVLSS